MARASVRGERSSTPDRQHHYALTRLMYCISTLLGSDYIYMGSLYGIRSVFWFKQDSGKVNIPVRTGTRHTCKQGQCQYRKITIEGGNLKKEDIRLTHLPNSINRKKDDKMYSSDGHCSGWMKD